MAGLYAVALRVPRICRAPVHTRVRGERKTPEEPADERPAVAERLDVGGSWRERTCKYRPTRPPRAAAQSPLPWPPCIPGHPAAPAAKPAPNTKQTERPHAPR
ncbi:hypothetical protein H1C71_014897, partial [Ictidomys tridecemlineatus]